MNRLLFTVVVSIVLVSGVIGCTRSTAPTQVPATTPDVARYTADQVIYVAKSYSPTCLMDRTPSFTVTYEGHGVWLVKKYCITNVGYNKLFDQQWYFYESSGKLVAK